jgi:2-amino-4-hydroxy-6-hydroxymethyldihydropteridine diphosphokinase
VTAVKAVVVTAYIGIGSNLPGEYDSPAQQVRVALQQLDELAQTACSASSSLYRSTPMGPQDQPDYINAVAQIQTRLPAEQLLDALQRIEQQHGRERKQHWGARTLDLDILLYADVELQHEHLRLPHPGLCEREFVLIPLLELAPQLVVPGRGKLSAIAQQCPAAGLVRLSDVAVDQC